MCMMYSFFMLRINIYIPEDLNKKLAFVAKTGRRAKAEVIRDALEQGLGAIAPKLGNARTLLNLAKMAEKIPTAGRVPKDFSKNLDYYTWGGKKRE